MSASAPDSAALDLLLLNQLVIAHAGESSPDDPRLGWWQTDILSRDGGLDVLRRLTPRTWRWAALRAVREAARAFDAAQRKRAPDPDRVWTLFHLGFTLDEQLDDRLDQLAAAHPEDPLAALPALAQHIDFDGRRPFDRKALEAWLGASPTSAPSSPSQTYDTTTLGRRVTDRDALAVSPSAAAAALRAALAPLTAAYPMPYLQS